MCSKMKRGLIAFFLTGSACFVLLFVSVYAVNFGLSGLVGSPPPFDLPSVLGLCIGASLSTGVVNGAMVYFWHKA
jgi:hypothetical protein